MPSINNLTPGARSMNGLNTLSANDINADTLDVDVLIINSAGTAPNRPLGDDTTNIANTAFVKDAVDTATANLATLDTTQTFTSGTKFFTNNPQSLTSAAPTLNNEYTNKLYVDNQISTAGGTYVSIAGNQTITGNKSFTGTTILGNILSADQPCKVSITNNTTSDTSINGTIGGESVYHQARFGARAFYISQGLTDSQNQYFGVSGSGAPDPEFVLTLRNGVGLKVSNGLDTSSFTEVLKVVGTSRFTGVGTFEVSPVCAVAPTTANQLVPKTYVDTNFVNLTGTQTITGNKTTTGNAIFWPTSGTTTIRGSQCDIFADTTYLTGNTTSISGVNCNMNSTTNYISGTITYLASPTVIVNSTVNSFYVDASYSNFVGKNTLLQSPYTAITNLVSSFVNDSAATTINSPYMAITSACTSLNLNATNTTITGNTNMTGSVVTATTQIATDNSTKLATTAFVNNYATANYMTLTTNQNVSGVKTYSTQQIFNAGLTSNNIYASGVVDTNFCTNMGNGILTLGNNKIVCDTFGVRMINLNTQLNEGCFIQPNPSLAVGEEPLINFPADQVANFANTGNAGEADATKQVNIGSNLADTALFSMPSLGTIVRPNTSFTLDTTIIPQGVYNIFAYVRIQNAFGSNVLNTMTWNLSASPSTLVSTQNYNTYKDYTFTSRNLYHCFRNTAMCGVFIINNIATQQNIMTPIHYSITDFTNFTFQGAVAGALTTPAITGGTAVGSWVGLSINNADNIYLVYPNYSIILYDATGWSGVPILNFKNTTLNPVTVRPTTTQIGSSCRIYFDEVQLIKY